MGRGSSKAGKAGGGATVMVLREMADSSRATDRAGLTEGKDYTYDWGAETYNITASGLKKLKKAGYGDKQLKIMQRGSTMRGPSGPRAYRG